MTFEEIRARHVSDGLPDGTLRPHTPRLALSEMHRDRGALIEMVEALQHLAHPHDRTKGICPLVLYFPTEQDREGFAALVRTEFPGWKSVKLP